MTRLLRPKAILWSHLVLRACFPVIFLWMPQRADPEGDAAYDFIHGAACWKHRDDSCEVAPSSAGELIVSARWPTSLS